MTEKFSPRIEWVDFAKGVVIILMVLGHVIEGVSVLSKIIYVFHMPFFFITAGFLLNLDKWGGRSNYKSFEAKLVKRLLVPYFLVELLWYPIWFVVCHEGGYLRYLWSWCERDPVESFVAIFTGNDYPHGLPLGPMWFLPALLLTEIIFVKLYNRVNRLDMKIFAIAAVICAVIGLTAKDFFILPMSLDIALVSQIFLLAGILIRKNNVVERIDLKFCLLFELILIAAFYFNIHVDMNHREYGNPLLFYAGGIAGTLLVMKLSALMSTGNKIFSLISDCGRQSMMILVLHPIVASILYEIFAAMNFNPRIFFKAPEIIFAVTWLGTIVPLWIAKRFGKLPVLKNFCA